MAPKKAAFFGEGSVMAVAGHMMWLAAFFAGVTACAAGITFPPQSSTFVLQDECVPGLDEYNRLYLACFASIISCTLQSCVAIIPHWIIGSRKRLDRAVPPSSCRWCRAFLFLSVIFFTVSLSCLVVISDSFLVVRIGKAVCWSPGTWRLVTAANVMAGLSATVILVAGSYISYYCY